MKLSLAVQAGSSTAWRAYRGGLGVRSARSRGGAVRYHSGDGDVAELGLADRFAAQVQGMTEALRIANGALTLAQASKEALADIAGRLEQLRTVAEQAGATATTDTDREALQAQVETLVAEIDEIADASVTDPRRLEDPTFDPEAVRVQEPGTPWMAVRLHEARPSLLGFEHDTLAMGSSTERVTEAALDPADLTLNGARVRMTFDTDDTASTESRAGSAIAKALAINDGQGVHGVFARPNPNELVGSEPVQPGVIGIGDLAINGVVVDGVAVRYGDAGSTLRSVVNARCAETGVSADVDELGRLVLTAEDGRNVRLALAGAAETITRMTAGLHPGSLRLLADSDVSVGGDAPGVAGLREGVIYAVQVTADLVEDLDVTRPEDAETALRTIEEAIDQVGRQQRGADVLLDRYEAAVLDLARDTLRAWTDGQRRLSSSVAARMARAARSQLEGGTARELVAKATLPPELVLTLTGP